MPSTTDMTTINMDDAVPHATATILNVENLSPPPPAPAPTYPWQLKSGRAELLIDDVLIESTEQLERNFHPARKRPEPVIKAEAPWEIFPLGEMGIFGAGGVIYDETDKLWKAWLQVGEHATKPGCGYYTSEDGIQWERPNLGIIEFNASRDNNLVVSRETLPDYGCCVCAFKDTIDPHPQGRYKLFMSCKDWKMWDDPNITDKTRAKYYQIASSGDGTHWRFGEPFQHDGTADVGFMCIDEEAGKYRWYKRTRYIPTKRLLFSLSVVDAKIYAFGGTTLVERRGKKINKTVTAIEVYDPSADAWEKIGDTPQARLRMSSVALNGKIYVIGGDTNAGGGGTLVEVFDPAQNTWAEVANLNESRLSQTATVVKGKIYAIGGFRKENTWLKTIEAYDPATDTWQNRKDMPTGRYELSPTTPAVNGKIYVIGGGNEAGQFARILGVVEEYDPGKNEWTKMAPMPTARQGLSVATVQGKLYAIGGVPRIGDPPAPPFAAVEEYTPEGWPFTVSPQGKLATAWGTIKAAD